MNIKNRGVYILLILSSLYLLSIVVIISLIFVERRSIQSTIAWVIVLLLFPVIGVFVYFLFGRRIITAKKISLKKSEDTALKDYLSKHSGGFVEKLPNSSAKCDNDTITMFNNLGAYTYSEGNEVNFYFESNEFFDALLSALKNAKKSINIQFYIFKNDDIGSKIIRILEEKQQEGVRVKLLYDAMGSRGLSKKDFSKLISYGGKVSAFLPSKIKFLNINLNYRNHRKLVIVDGGANTDYTEESAVGFIGGFNIGDEYLGRYKKFGYWRDTHLKVRGPAVKLLNLRFLLDWCFSTKEEMDLSAYISTESKPCGDVSMHIVSSGPDMLEEEIKYGYLKMINDATSYVYIQSPYFILDSSLLEALKIACYKGVDVRIMIPAKPDHPFVYWASYSFIGELLPLGAKVYTYSSDAFLHAKTVVIDDSMCSVGTANMDIRSFALNFEVNAFMYSPKISIAQRNQFLKDIKVSKELTLEDYKNRSTKTKVKESISRLLSPIL